MSRLTPKRLLLLVGFYALYAIVETTTWTCFVLDRIFYPDFLKVVIKSPVFIIGNPRSGTTFLHRMLALDEINFSCMRMWEIFFAPSIVQRKILCFLNSLDRRFGGYGRKFIQYWDTRLYDANVIHRTGLSMPEEDEYLMIHLGSTIIGGLVFGFLDEAIPFVQFDEVLKSEEKIMVARFYKRCLQRHMYYHGPEHIFLSKNPFFTPKVDMLLRAFPDALFIYLARNPLKVVPSFASLSAFWWRIFCDTEIKYPHIDFILKTVQYWYQYPLERLVQDPQAKYNLVKFEDMVQAPKRVITRIYNKLGLEIDSTYGDVLDEEMEKLLYYKSKHKYSLEEIGYTRIQILSEFKDVFQRWSFDE